MGDGQAYKSELDLKAVAAMNDEKYLNMKQKKYPSDTYIPLNRAIIENR